MPLLSTLAVTVSLPFYLPFPPFMLAGVASGRKGTALHHFTPERRGSVFYDINDSDGTEAGAVYIYRRFYL